MFKIRQELLDALTKDMEDRFKHRLCQHLRTAYVSEVAALNAEQLQQFVATGIDKAMAYQIDIEGDIADYLVLLLRHGMDFEQQPKHRWALAILQNPEMAGGMKIQALEERFENQRGPHG